MIGASAIAVLAPAAVPSRRAQYVIRVRCRPVRAQNAERLSLLARQSSTATRPSRSDHYPLSKRSSMAIAASERQRKHASDHVTGCGWPDGYSATEASKPTDALGPRGRHARRIGSRRARPGQLVFTRNIFDV